MAQNPQENVNVDLSRFDSTHHCRNANDSNNDPDFTRHFGLDYGDEIPLLPQPENHSSQRAYNLVISFLLNSFSFN